MTNCFIVVVNKAYRGYVPLYVYFALRAYPESFVRVYYLDNEDGLGEDVSRLVNSPNWSIECSYKMDYPRHADELKTLRWVLYDDVIKGFDTVYIGDVDIPLSIETPGLIDEHLRHCDFLGLPYSNVWRMTGGQKQNRASGLHFIKVKEYFEVMLPVIEKYDSLLRNGKLHKVNNEMTLFRMLTEADIGVGAWESANFDQASSNPEKLCYRPHHGLHLRVFDYPNKQILESGIYREYGQDFLLAVEENPRIIEGLPDSVLRQVKKAMSRFK